MPNKITYLGHSAVKIVTSKGLKVFIDPFLTGNPSCPDECQDDIDADLVLVTHGHGDHVGDTMRIMKKGKATFAGIYELATWVGTKIDDPDRVIGFGKGGTVEFHGIKVSMFNAVHSSGINELEGFSLGGAEAGFILQLEDGTLIYHAGDTDVFMEMQLLPRLFDHNIDIAMLPIGGHFTMDPKRAAIAVDLIKPKKVLPIHYATWPPLAGTPDELRNEMDKIRLKDIEIIAAAPGDSFEI